MKNNILKVTESVRALGIILDKKLKYDLRITQTENKSKWAKTFRSVGTFKVLYCALIRSHMEFGVLMWNPELKKHSDALEKIQRRFFRYVYLRVFQPAEILQT